MFFFYHMVFLLHQSAASEEDRSEAGGSLSEALPDKAAPPPEEDVQSRHDRLCATLLSAPRPRTAATTSCAEVFSKFLGDLDYLLQTGFPNAEGFFENHLQLVHKLTTVLEQIMMLDKDMPVAGDQSGIGEMPGSSSGDDDLNKWAASVLNAAEALDFAYARVIAKGPHWVAFTEEKTAKRFQDTWKRSVAARVSPVGGAGEQQQGGGSGAVYSGAGEDNEDAGEEEAAAPPSVNKHTKSNFITKSSKPKEASEMKIREEQDSEDSPPSTPGTSGESSDSAAESTATEVQQKPHQSQTPVLYEVYSLPPRRREGELPRWHPPVAKFLFSVQTTVNLFLTQSPVLGSFFGVVLSVVGGWLPKLPRFGVREVGTEKGVEFDVFGDDEESELLREKEKKKTTSDEKKEASRPRAVCLTDFRVFEHTVGSSSKWDAGDRRQRLPPKAAANLAQDGKRDDDHVLEAPHTHFM